MPHVEITARPRDVDIGELQHFVFRHARFRDDRIPAFGAQIVGEGIETDRMLGDELDIEHARRALLRALRRPVRSRVLPRP